MEDFGNKKQIFNSDNFTKKLIKTMGFEKDQIQKLIKNENNVKDIRENNSKNKKRSVEKIEDQNMKFKNSA